MCERAALMANPSNDRAVITYLDEIGMIFHLSAGLFEHGLLEGLTLCQFIALSQVCPG